MTHSIPTGDATPIKQPPRRVPHALRPVIDQQVQKMIESGVIQPSVSPWSSPVVLVRKKDGGFRFCVDYRRVNSVTVKDSFPLPRVDETLDVLSGAKIFSALDLASGYWQVPVEPADVPKTAFSTSRGLFDFTVMPFGLTNAPATFQRLMDRVLSGLNWEQCLVYLDDVLVFSHDLASHLERVERVLERIDKAGLKLKPRKCQFGKPEVDYLGHVISANGISPQGSKVEAVLQFPVPTNVTAVRNFLGLAGYYRRFVSGFSVIASPLFDLLKKDRPFVWTDDCQVALDTLKVKLTSSPVLMFPRLDEAFYLATDASGTGLGAVLFQKGEKGEERVVAYASRALNAAERGYSVIEREALGLVWAVTHFRVYLYGHPFVLITDHCPLTWLKTVKDPSGRIARWLLTLSEYHWDIQHKSGKTHRNADALSRSVTTESSRPFSDATVDVDRLKEMLPPTVGAVGVVPQWSHDDMARLQAEDSLIGKVLECLPGNKPAAEGLWISDRKLNMCRIVWDSFTRKDGVLYRHVVVREGVRVEKKLVLVVPSALVPEIL